MTLKANLAVAVLFCMATASAAQQHPGYRDIAVPTAAGAYPIPSTTLTDMRNLEQTSALRAHGWALFAGVTAPADPKSGEPIWTTWFTRTEAFGKGCSDSPDKRVYPRFEFQLPLEIVANFEARGRSEDNVHKALEDAVQFFSNPITGALRSAMLYNRAACQHIFDNHFYDENALRAKLDGFKVIDAPPEEMEIDQFPQGSIVVKSSWLRIDAGGATVCLWIPSDTTPATCQPLGMHQLRVIPVNPSAPCVIVPNQPVPTSCFYNIPVTTLNITELSRTMTVAPGDVLVLVGLHVITKELSDWVWSTFWWQAGPDAKGFGADRPLNLLTAPWTNYAMDVTLSMETPREKQNVTVSATGKCRPRCTPNAKICFNPYLEGNLRNGQYSNCMNCHKQATFPRLVPDPTGTVQRGYLSSDAQCFADKQPPTMRVDYLWTLSPTSTENPLRSFLDQLLKSLKIDLSQK